MLHPLFVTSDADVPVMVVPGTELAGQVMTTGADANSRLNTTAFAVGVFAFGVMSTLPVRI